MSFPGRAAQRTWHLVDAASQTVGRLATTIAPILKGKHKPTYRPGADIGDYVVIVNADKVHFSGKKWDDKIYRWHTGYPGGLKERPAKAMLDRKPEAILRKAILGMIYRNNLRHGYIEPRLKIYSGPKHPHELQLPKGTNELPVHPRKRMGSFHFGLGSKYSETSFQVNEQNAMEASSGLGNKYSETPFQVVGTRMKEEFRRGSHWNKGGSRWSKFKGEKRA